MFPRLLCLLTLTSLGATDGNLQYYEGPPDKSQAAFDVWWSSFQVLRDEIRESLDLSIYYNVSEVEWARTSFIQPQLMIHDRFLYDRNSGEWTVGKYLEDVRSRYGGIDSVLLWASYPNIGVDDRNQFDMLEDLPGGLEGLRTCVEDFHAHGVKVLLPYNPWDQGTRNVGIPDYEKLVDQIVLSAADGFNGDVLDGVNQTYWEEGLRRGHPIVMEPEVLMSNYSYLSYNAMSWGYWTPGARDLVVPYVAMYKAVTEGRHLHHITERWAQQHEDGIQQAFFNGAGFESWENVWGVWNGITERDAEGLRRTSAILREFGGLLQGGEWTPHVVVTGEDNLVFTSQFRDPITGDTVWLMVNRDKENDVRVSLNLQCTKARAKFLDIYHGFVLDETDSCAGVWQVQVDLEASGYGAVLLTEEVGNEELTFLETMAEMTANPLSSFNDDWTPLTQTLETNLADENMTASGGGLEDVLLVEGGFFNFFVLGTCIEGDRLPTAVDVQFPWESHPQRSHQHILEMSPLYSTKYPITNADYKKFLDETKWRPKDDHNWLRHWTSTGEVTEGQEKQPVTWVSVRDAATYCSYYGMRLPTSWEWQWVAQGPDLHYFPWGDELDLSLIPSFTSERELPPPDDVDSHPGGRSWCGAEDLVGNVYQWTSVHTDLHTSRAVLRGGSHWRPEGSHWYQPQPTLISPLYEHNTYLLMSDSLDRSANIGFRCVADAEAE